MKMTQERTLELMDLAIENFKEVLEKNDYVDDCSCWDGNIVINIFRYYPKKAKKKDICPVELIGTFRFGYDPEDLWERSDEDQLRDAFQDFIRFEY